MKSNLYILGYQGERNIQIITQPNLASYRVHTYSNIRSNIQIITQPNLASYRVHTYSNIRSSFINTVSLINLWNRKTTRLGSSYDLK